MGYMFHKRAEWLGFSRFGMSGPAQDRGAVRQITVHYNGDNQDLDGPDDVFDDDDYARVIADINNSYWDERGYAAGYNFGVAPNGDLWEIRGLDIRCAANGCQPVNIPSVSVQITTRTVESDPTREQLDALKNHWIPWLRSQYPFALKLNKHSELRSQCGPDKDTKCPGVKVAPLVDGGFFESPDASPEGDDDVKVVYLRDEQGTHYKTTNATHQVWTLTLEQFRFADDLARLGGQPLDLLAVKDSEVTLWGNVVPVGSPQ